MSPSPLNRLRSAGLRRLNRVLLRRGYEALPISVSSSQLSVGTGMLLGLSLSLGRRISIAVVGAGCEPNSSLDPGTGFIARFSERVESALLVDPVGSRLENTLKRIGDPRDVRLSASVAAVGRAEGEDAQIWSVDQWAKVRLGGGGAGWASSNRHHVARLLAETLMISLDRAELHVEPIWTPVRGLSELLDEFAMQEIDYIQVDVEGYDDEVLFSLDFSRHRPLFVRFEFVHLSSSRLERLGRHLGGHGYVREFDDGLDRVYRRSAPMNSRVLGRA